MDNIIAFNGYLGQRNIGDEAIYDAAELLFENCQLIDYQYCENPDLVLYGGGTLLPPKPSRRSFPHHIPRAAIGMGVEDPEFRNKPRGARDLGYYLGNLGYDNILRNKFIQFAATPLNYAFNLKTTPYQLPDERFDHLHDFEFLSVRGPLSAQLLEQYNIDCDVIGDTALMLEPSIDTVDGTGRVGITLRDGGKKWSDDTSYQEILTDFLSGYAQDSEFVLIPLSPSDIPLHQRLAKRLPNSELKDYCTQPDVQAVIDEYAGCDLVYGEKLHGSVLSACSYTPFISLGYQPKNQDFAQSVGLDEFHIRISDLTKNWLQKHHDKVINNNEVTHQLENEVSAQRKALQQKAVQIKNKLL